MSGYIRHSYEHLNLDPNTPFKDDVLERSRFSRLLTSLVQNYSSGFVMAINGSWGTGKTVFMHQWLYSLRANGFRATIFNAWDNDYFGEPTIAILSQFSDFFDDSTPLPVKAVARWKTLQSIPQSVIKGFLKKKASDLVGEDAIKEISDTFDVLENTNIAYRNSDIAKYLTERFEFEKYKTALIEFASEISEPSKPLVFIIDELDRCTPSYAVEVLEKIKHLFNIPNIIFCISVDKEQLKRTIQGYYGAYNFNAEEYLRRFFDIELALPPIKYQEFAHLMSSHFELNKYIHSEAELYNFITTSAEMAEKKHLTLRQLEKYFAHAKLVFSYYHTDKSVWLIAIMLIIHKFDNEMYEAIVNRLFSLKDYASKLKYIFDFSEYGKGPGQLGAFLYHINVYLNIGRLISVPNDFRLEVDSYDFSDEDIDKMSRSFVGEFQCRNTSLQKIIEKINFVEQFIDKQY